MKILIDMNLSPDWVQVLEKQGWRATHWSAVGDMRAPDKVIFDWAREHGQIVFTHDLDFGAILASTQAQFPSVIQIRTQDTFPENLSARLAQVLKEYENQLESGALITIDADKFRVRILPLKR